MRAREEEELFVTVFSIAEGFLTANILSFPHLSSTRWWEALIKGRHKMYEVLQALFSEVRSQPTLMTD